jgi:hypothetical protein
MRVDTDVAVRGAVVAQSHEGEFAEVVQAAIRRWYSMVTTDYARMAMYAALETPERREFYLFNAALQCFRAGLVRSKLLISQFLRSENDRVLTAE